MTWPRRSGISSSALMQDPTNREAIQGLGLVLERMGEREKAESFRQQGERVEEAVRFARASSVVHESAEPTVAQTARGDVRILGRQPEARAWYGLLLSLDPLDSEVQQALYRLRDEPS